MKKSSLYVLLIFIVALSFRLVRFDQLERSLVPDEAEHDALARGIIAGRGYSETLELPGPRMGLKPGQPTAWRTPGFPLILAGIYCLFGLSTTRAKLVLVCLACLISVLIYFLSQLLFEKPGISIMAGLIWAASATSIDLSWWLLGEETAALAVVLVLILIIMADQKNSLSRACLAGLIGGFAILIRGFLIPLPLALAGWLILRKKHRPAFACFAFALLFPAGWMLRNAMVMNTFGLSTQTSLVIWSGNNAWARGSWPGNWAPQHAYLLEQYPNFDALDEVGRARVFGREAWRDAVGNPGRILWLLPRKGLIFFSPISWIGTDWVYAALLPFAMVGAYFLFCRKKDRHILFLFGGAIAATISISLISYADVRFRHPIDPLIVILGSAGIYYLFDRLWITSRSA